MTELLQTPYGNMRVLERDQIFSCTLDAIEALANTAQGDATVALTGGSTPKAFYQWAGSRALSDAVHQHILWTTSDERMVPLESDESNFGNADRDWLVSQKVDESRKWPWPVQVDPHSAAAVYNRKWNDRFGLDRCYDLCLLGMGDDGHTASLFPGSPLLGDEIQDSFACVEVPGKGWRLTLTVAGLLRCRQILITVTGASKAERLKAVMEEPAGSYPVQVLQRCADRVIWLVDADAAALLR